MYLTRAEIFEEYANCISSPIYVIESYFETFDKTQEGFVPFHLFERQKEIIYAYEKHRYNIVTKPRQAGVSTTTAAYLAAKIGFADDTNPESVLIVANKQDLAFEFLAKIKDFLTQIPRWAWGPEYYGNPKNDKKTIFIKDSQKEIKLPNGCRVKAVATSKDALRGFTPTYLIMDEAAYIENGKELFGAALTALGTGGRAFLISTPNGMDELYYTTYAQSKSGDNDFNVIEMKWYEDKRYNKDLSWIKGEEQVFEVEFSFESYRKMLAEGYKPTSTWYQNMCRGMNNDAKMIAQELDVSFIGSGGNVVHEDDIEYQKKNNVRDPLYKFGEKNEIWVWEEPKEGHQYILGVDVSRGDGEDFSSMVMVDYTEMEQVMEYKGKIQPDLLAQLVEQWGNRYKAYTVVDATGGMGISTILKLLEFDYKRLHYETPNGKILSEKQREIANYGKDNKLPGFHITHVRGPMIANFEYKVRTNEIKIRSIRLVTEMETFVYKDGKPDHLSGYHDDLIFALAMPLWVMEHAFKNLEKLEKQTKAMLNSWVGGANEPIKSSAQLTYEQNEKRNAFVYIKDNVKVAAPKPKFSPVVAKNMQDPTGQYLWLFSGTK